MNYLDLIIIVFVAGGLIWGTNTGLIKQVASIVGVILGVLGGLQFMDIVGPMVISSVGLSPELGPLLGFLVVFFAIVLAVIGVTKYVDSLIGTLKLKPLDRLLGGAVGALKSALVLGVAFLLLSFLNFPNQNARDSSLLFKPFNQTVETSWQWVSVRIPQAGEFMSERFRVNKPRTNDTDAVAPSVDAGSETDGS